MKLSSEEQTKIDTMIAQFDRVKFEQRRLVVTFAIFVALLVSAILVSGCSDKTPLELFKSNCSIHNQGAGPGVFQLQSQDWICAIPKPNGEEYIIKFDWNKDPNADSRFWKKPI